MEDAHVWIAVRHLVVQMNIIYPPVVAGKVTGRSRAVQTPAPAASHAGGSQQGARVVIPDGAKAANPEGEGFLAAPRCDEWTGPRRQALDLRFGR
jgi:hypothetical protein